MISIAEIVETLFSRNGRKLVLKTVLIFNEAKCGK